MVKAQHYLIVACLALLAAIMACVSAESEGGAQGGATVPVVEASPGATLEFVGVQGKLYFGELSSPSAGHTALFVHTNDTLDFLVVDTNDVSRSSYMTGTIEGQRAPLTEDLGRAQALGRPGENDFEVTITFPGVGFVRSLMNVTEAGALYKGELNGVAAGLMVLADGTPYGFAVVETGDNPALEFLCVDGTIEGTPDEITAKTCDTGQEVTLTLVKD